MGSFAKYFIGAFLFTAILAITCALGVNSFTVGKVYASTVIPTPMHTYLPGISKSVLIEAEKCETSSSNVKRNYVILNDEEWITTGNVYIGSENGPSYTLDEMQVSLAVEGKLENKQIEVRYSSPTGEVAGMIDLSKGTIDSYHLYKTMLQGSYADGFGDPVKFYLIYKGEEGAVKINWIYITKTNAIAVPTPAIEPVVVLGDLDRDDKLTSVDFALLRKYFLGYGSNVDMDYWLEVADVDGDGELTSIDFGLFRKYLLGIIKNFPIETSQTSVVI